MSLGTNALHNATASMSRSFAVAQNSMAQSLERIASGKRFTKASQDLGGYVRAVDLDVDIEKFGRMENSLTELSATLEQAIAAGNSVMEDLKGLRNAWADAEAYTDATPEDLAAKDLAAGYQATIVEKLAVTAADGKVLISNAAAWATATMTGGNTLTVALDGETLATGAEATAAAATTSLDNMASYVGKLQQYKATVDSQVQMATVMRQNSESVLSALTSIDEAEEMTKFVEQDIRSQAAVSMVAQANMSQRNISLLYR